jgi:hypothetical protein
MSQQPARMTSPSGRLEATFLPGAASFEIRVAA